MRKANSGLCFVVRHDNDNCAYLPQSSTTCKEMDDVEIEEGRRKEGRKKLGKKEQETGKPQQAVIGRQLLVGKARLGFGLGWKVEGEL